MKLEDFDYHLPPELIAQFPAPRRADSRMLVIHRAKGSFEDTSFKQLTEFLKPHDVLTLNNSRVVPARLFGHRRGEMSQPVGKRNPQRQQYLTSPIEALLTRQLDERTWEALVKPGRKVRNGEQLIFQKEIGVRDPGELLEAEVIGRGDFGVRTLRFAQGTSVSEILQKVGHVPLPPYIRRPDEEQDRLRYQTVYAKELGSVAAPTAGLHFTKAMLSRIHKRGIERVEITLHVGLGTFQPIHTDEIGKHHMHSEPYEVRPKAAGQLNEALSKKRRIVAVGTTTVRTLEHIAALHDGRIEAGSSKTMLFILPGFEFRVIGGMLTNFHLPRTTLLMLIAAFAGRELTLAAYQHAVRERYRFYSSATAC